MIRQEEISSTIDSQKEEFIIKTSFIERDELENLPVIDSFATIITGIRRCGKSTLLLQYLKQQKGNIIYFNFDDIRLAEFETSDFLRFHNEIKSRKADTIVLDEVQIIDKWEIYVHQLLREGYKVFVTGSNASLLSRELGTHLTGRHISMELFPFSYSEYVKYVKTDYCEKSLLEYFELGGMPEYVKNKQIIILQSLLDNILMRDIVVRHNIKDSISLRSLSVYLLSNVGNLVSANKLVGMFGVKSSTTILDYMSYLSDSYIIDFVPKFSYSIKTQARNPRKVYSIDIGLIKAASISFTEDIGQRFENLIYLHLRRKYKEIYYYQDKGECDFLVVEKGKVINAVQVCYKITNENFEREYNGLLQAMKAFDLKTGTIVTLNSQDIFEKDGLTINLVPAHIYLTK
ncbi:MAG: ATP-binding protein [Bacteroidales bacterium]|nr:ATP-binding protein [Bacteroidales bacterium]